MFFLGKALEEQTFREAILLFYLKSITEQLYCLPEETIVYSGHGMPTTIGHVKAAQSVCFRIISVLSVKLFDQGYLNQFLFLSFHDHKEKYAESTRSPQHAIAILGRVPFLEAV